MNNKCRLNEDRLPLKLSVVFSSEIRKRIETIYSCHQKNVDGLSQWYDYLNGIKRYISNPAIAWDNTNRYSKFPNGAIFSRDFNYNVAYVVKTDKHTNQPFVYVFKVNLNPEEFGLKSPSTVSETIRRAVLPILEFNQRLSAIR